jgi:hypothetical protein
MRLRSSVISAAAVVGLAAGIGVGTSAAASAGVTTPQVTAAATATPDVNNALLYPGVNETGGATAKPCFTGSSDEVAADSSNPVKSVANNCEYRIYLQQNFLEEPGHGWAYCINPRSSVNVPADRQIPHGLLIGAAKACGA